MGSTTENGRGREEVIKKENEKEAIVIMEQNERFCMFPIRYNHIWKMYKKSVANFCMGTQLRL
ncbi:putative oxidoreductase [Lupinus albus]|uniref:Putative oxidoreductase n=1 Tax=Lupinus albus TaxID=3870 RepID=A0A6A4Q880_LUPAL|nr:putative oxidoreductase [Lupinus albus]